MLLAVMICASATSAAGRPQTPRVNPDAATINDFMKRVSAYVDLHNKLDGTLQEVPKGSPPEQFIDHQRALGRLIQNARLSAKQGDLCTKEMRSVIRRLLAGIFRGPDGRQIKRSILDEDTLGVRLQVNGMYTDSVPLSSVPPQVLQVLPPLPEVLEYRFIGERLILLDAHAHIIVDFVEQAFP
jgi:hypothetical protein